MSTPNAILLAALLVAAAVAGYLVYDARDTGDAAEVATAAAPSGPAEAAPQSARIRPVFSLPDLTGVERSITEWDGQALVVNFWATWCAPCLREIPVLIDLHDELRERNIQIIGIAVDNPDAVSEFAARTDFNYPVLVGEQASIDAAEAFGAEVVGLPLTVFTGYDGQVLEIHAGEITRAELTAALEALPPPDND